MNINATLLGQAIWFAVFIWITMKFVWPPMKRAMEQRQKQIADGLAAAERGRQDLELAAKRAEELLREARTQAQEILSQAEKRAAQVVDEAKGQAKAEGDRIVTAAKSEIDQEVFRAKEALRIAGRHAGGAGRGEDSAPRSRREGACRLAERGSGGALARHGGNHHDRPPVRASGVRRSRRRPSSSREWSEMLHFMADVYTQSSKCRPRWRIRSSPRKMSSGCCSPSAGEKLRQCRAQSADHFWCTTIVSPRCRKSSHLYERLKEQYENVLEATIESAFPLEQTQLGALVAKLEKRTGRKIQPSVAVVPTLIGGVKIQIGDDVWDASVRGQLDSMASALAS